MRKLGNPRRISSKPLDKELGFGRNVATSQRLMNADGTFNVQRQTIGFFDNTYHFLINLSWGKFFLLALLFFIVMNSIFAVLYCLIGVENLDGMKPGTYSDNLLQAFFFSSQTLTTVGYGHISPMGYGAGLMASFESFLGLLLFALISGLLYGRFSRPTAKIVYSENLLVAPYREGHALMFRMVNARRSEMVETEVQILMAFNQRDDAGNTIRKFYPLELEISKINFFSLSWTVVHPLDDKSPIFSFSEQDLLDANAEFMVMVKGIDETAQQAVHSRHSYIAEDIIWNAKFSPVIVLNERAPRVISSQIGKYDILESVN